MQLDLPLPRTDYCIRESKRVRNMQLSVSPAGSIEVIVPKGTDLRAIPTFVHAHDAWLNKVLARIKQKRCVEHDELTPSFTRFPAVNELWQIQYRKDKKNYFDIHNDSDLHNTVRIHYRHSDQVAELLSLWLTDFAKRTLLPWLFDVSREIGISYHNASVRAQKTRWGSCSVRKHISVNRCLMFLKPTLVRYLFIHELCHTIHLNHSKRYWSLVAAYEPKYRQYEQGMNKAIYIIPRWAAC